MGAGHSTPGGLLNAPRNLLRSHQRTRQQREADNLSPQLFNNRSSTPPFPFSVYCAPCVILILLLVL